jgi:UDP-glucose 4-epimerase
MNILVTGGAGYIASFMTKRLLDDGYSVTVLDSLERNDKNLLDSRASFVKGNILDKQFVADLFSKNHFDGIIHFAGYISMAESMQNPGIYFENNTFGPVVILEEMKKHKVNSFIFSSTAGVYGNPTKIPIPEDNPTHPTNPYGESKLMVEQLLKWYNKIYGIGFVSLRYFNAAGAATDASLGERHNPETHIIPNAIAAVLHDKEFTLFGTDYKTIDGTCVRDYIHVYDLIEAHVLALKKLQKDSGGYIYNVGTGNGFSNKQVLEMVEKISGKKIKIKTEPRRPGDADTLIADPTKIIQELGFSPKFSTLENIVETAWKWHVKNSESKVQNS